MLIGAVLMTPTTNNRIHTGTCTDEAATAGNVRTTCSLTPPGILWQSSATTAARRTLGAGFQLRIDLAGQVATCTPASAAITTATAGASSMKQALLLDTAVLTTVTGATTRTPKEVRHRIPTAVAQNDKPMWSLQS